MGSFRSNITEKNELIKKISDFFSEKNLYNFILFLNDLFFKMKSSSFIKILVSTEFIKFSRLTLCDSNKSSKNNLQDNIANPNTIALEIKKLTERKQDDSISDKEKNIRINNAFSSASKNNKEKFLEEWNDFKNYVVNNQKILNI